jgi:hypothetical protein
MLANHAPSQAAGSSPPRHSRARCCCPSTPAASRPPPRGLHAAACRHRQPRLRRRRAYPREHEGRCRAALHERTAPRHERARRRSLAAGSREAPCSPRGGGASFSRARFASRRERRFPHRRFERLFCIRPATEADRRRAAVAGAPPPLRKRTEAASGYSQRPGVAGVRRSLSRSADPAVWLDQIMKAALRARPGVPVPRMNRAAGAAGYTAGRVGRAGERSCSRPISGLPAALPRRAA